jgi:DNA modification methylase
MLYPFQSAMVKWAVRRGRAAIFADCGLGKTFMQIEWAKQMGKRALIVAPLAVTHQTIAEAAKLGVTVRYVTTPDDADGISITNYQRLAQFVGAPYDAIVLDESSILKSLDGKTRTMLLTEFKSIPNRLCCTATPAPNDLTELGNHAEFLGIMSFKEMSATFFVKESNGSYWRLKGHAADGFYRWLATWSVYVRRPSDLGFDDGGFNLPSLTIEESSVEVKAASAGRLFAAKLSGIQDRTRVRKATMADRVARVAEIVSAPGQWIVWCGLNDEGRQLAKLMPDAELVEGSMEDAEKIAASDRWVRNESRVMIAKPSIYGFGMNFQHCHQSVFLGLGDSYEQYYQAIRRCWRYGQTNPVTVYIVASNLEEEIVRNVKRKEDQAEATAAEVVAHVRDYESAEVLGATRQSDDYKTDEANGDNWRLMLGDSAERLREIESGSVGMSVFSPPFVSLYTYSNTERDLGNCRDEALFFEQFAFIIDELKRVTMPGRNCCVHVSQVPAMLVRDGYIGMKDFRAATVAAFMANGWIYHGEVVIDKDPQAQAIRTKSKGLLFVQMDRDSAWLRPALADYILVFRAPGENAVPIKADLTREEWIHWARPIWYGIDETNTLNVAEARNEKDERHICPLQLGVIERCIRLWTNAGDIVLSPFAGIGSEGFEAVRLGRRFVGCELKPDYWRAACRNLAVAESEVKRTRLFA